MPHADPDRLRAIKTFPQLVKYLRDDLEWPIESEDFDDLTFDYAPEELGLDPKTAVKVKEIKQLRPLASHQPWGIFFLQFEPKRLPVVVLRRILRALVVRNRASAGKAHQAAWNLHDLLFISSYGESDHRDISFAHFAEGAEGGYLPTLKVLGWDDEDTVLHLDHAHKTLQEKLRWPDENEKLEMWRERWSSAFTLEHRQVIKTSKELAAVLAAVALRIRKRVKRILTVETERGALRQLMAGFREALIHDLTEDGFADTYAQTITYGLLAGRIERPNYYDAGSLSALPVTNPFLRDLLSQCMRIGGRQGGLNFDELGIGEVTAILNSPDTDMEAVLRDFGDKNPQEDPVIHFYEGFAKEYDPIDRFRRGEFYTPQPVVSYIVRSVHELLRTEFDLEDGLADTATWGDMENRHKGLKRPARAIVTDPFVRILDPATGTGTFLVEAIEVIHKTMVAKWKREGHYDAAIEKRWNAYVPDHLLPRLFGFELKMAPYAIAHMKLGLKLKETGYSFDRDERAQVYLTNSLEPPGEMAPSLPYDSSALAQEAQAVAAIKKTVPFTVVMGNPPYASISSNLTPECRCVVDPFRYIAGERIRERSMLQFEKNIQDDYVKFLALSQATLRVAGSGVAALITNHSFLDGPTLRGVRWNLTSQHDVTWFLDLHGNSNKSEIPPPGVTDQNVFDIKQGVSISAFMARPSKSQKSRTLVCEWWGNRGEKNARLLANSLSTTDFKTIDPEAPYYYLGVQQPHETFPEWAGWPMVIDIFTKRSTGTETGFDELLVGLTAEEVRQRVALFACPASPKAVIERTFDISVGHASELFDRRKELQRIEKEEIKPFQIRAYDLRYALLRKNLLKTNSFNVMLDLGQKSPGLVTTRQTKERFSAFAVNSFCGHKVTSGYDRSYVFPLFTGSSGALIASSVTCLSKDVIEKYSRTLNKAVTRPEDERDLAVDILGYVLACMNSLGYLARYEVLLKRDWPRIPLCDSAPLFRALAKLGREIVALHLLEFLLADEDQARSHSTRPTRHPEDPFEVGPSKDLGVKQGAGATRSFPGSPPQKRSQDDRPAAAGWPIYPRLTEFSGKVPSLEIEKISYSKKTVWLDKAQTVGFKGVPEDVFEFYIGGYKVCEKWLKDRKGRRLTADDILHYHKIVTALSNTIRIMKEIDKVIDKHGGWPGAFNAPKAE